jgi:TetR/AcrR family transcriptional regulator, regulator of cefoperazone and chloramphenicol sensitivity
MTSIRATSEPGMPTAGKSTYGDHLTRVKRTRDRAAKQRALFQAALKLFASKGYEATTTREIAAAARCAEGLIHRYFGGKAGLLTALIEYHFSQEVADLGRELGPGRNLQAEFIQLVSWEVERFWKTQEFRKVIISRSFVDPRVAEVMKRSGIFVRADAIRQRLQRYSCCSALPREQLQALAHAVGMLGLIFGFMRPIVLGEDRLRATRMAIIMAKMLVQSVGRGATVDQFL